MDFDVFFKWLYATPLAVTIRENEILFPWIESIHVLAIVLVVGTISIVDLRLLGLASVHRPVSRMMRDTLPYTWTCFAIAAITGALLFSSNAVTYAHNFYFRTKMCVLLLAALNMGIFHLFGGRDIAAWDTAARPPVAARAAGGISLLVWIAVVATGRWIGFTLR
jgi:hypothetical protein